MELEDLKLTWQSVERKLAAQNAMTFMQLKSDRSAQARSALHPLVVSQVLQISFGVVLAILFAKYWVNHRESPLLMACGILLQAYGVMFIIFGARILSKIRSIDYAAPVVEIQRRIAELRARRIRFEPIFWFTACFIWVPFLVVMLGFLRIELWEKDPNVLYWIVGNGLVSVALLAGFLLWVRLPTNASLAKRIESSMAGSSVEKAQRALAEIAEFERDATPTPSA